MSSPGKSYSGKDIPLTSDAPVHFKQHKGFLKLARGNSAFPYYGINIGRFIRQVLHNPGTAACKGRDVRAKKIQLELIRKRCRESVKVIKYARPIIYKFVASDKILI